MVSLLRVSARQILDSRGFPTVEVEVELSDGSLGRASVPSGASTGTHEALELRDNDPEHFSGKGVLQAIEHIHTLIAPAIINNDPFNQFGIDQEIVTRDQTDNLSTFGANAVLGVSLAISKAAANSLKLPYYRYIRQIFNQNFPKAATDRWEMPIPMFNIMNGGAHTRWESTDFQEFMVVPLLKHSFAYNLEEGALIYHHLGQILKKKNLSTLVGDEGGFAPSVASDQKAMELIIDAIQEAGLREGIDVGIALDAATSELFAKDHYTFPKTKKTFSGPEMIANWETWFAKYPLMSLEDGLAEDDWDNWQMLTQKFGSHKLIVGDDLLVTNLERIEKAIEMKACNALLMKVNQIGTLSESLAAIAMAKKAGWKVVVSHRSGETEDTSIADIAVGVNADFVKMGAPARSERTAKYNQLLRIEEAIATH